MVQDWDFDYDYLQHLENVIRINLKDHSYRDVNRTPVDFDSTTAVESEIPAWLNSKAHIWMYVM